MEFINNLGLSLKDVSIVPSIVSDISSRSECIPFDENGMLPLFTAPMSAVIDENNFHLFEENKINAILPRTVDIDIRLKYMEEGKWVALGLEEFEKFVLQVDIYNTVRYVLLDVANGHMKKVLDYISQAKKKHGDNIVIMGGNIANPKTYLEYAKAGCDLLRLGIGGGTGCTTSSNTSIHYPYVSLLLECVKYKKQVAKDIKRLIQEGRTSIEYKSVPKLIIDGTIKNYDDIIKALNLGADYCMCGGIFSKMLESAGETSVNNIKNSLSFETEMDVVKIDQYSQRAKSMFKNDIKPQKMFYGMSTKIAQKEMGKESLKTSEGLIKIIDVEYTMEGWVDNFKNYLKSAMSYCNCRNLKTFIGQQSYIVLTQNSVNSFNK